MEFKEFIDVARYLNLITPTQKLLLDKHTFEELETYYNTLDQHKCDVDCTGVDCEQCTLKKHYTDVASCLRIVRRFNEWTKANE